MDFGTTKITELLDDDGSTATTEQNIVKGTVNRPVRVTSEIKVRVHDQAEEHAAYLEFSDELKRDKTMLDPAWRIEHSRIGDQAGYYYVVKCYTRLEY